MKNTLTSILSIIFVFCFSLSLFAGNAELLEYNYENVSVIFNENTPFDSSQREKIVNALANNEASAEPAGLACIFGHNWIQDMVTTITHCVSDTQPRCLEEIFDIYMCSRCEKTKAELLGQSYIFCCD